MLMVPSLRRRLRQRLERAGVNNVNGVVDITNLVMLEQGQPLHAFDSDALERIRPTVDASSFPRAARNGEEFIGLDERKLVLTDVVQVVSCHDIPVAIAGVMGSLASGVTSTTSSIWLESAMFSAARVRRSARQVGLRTDASGRYEKGLPADLTLACSERATRLLEEQFHCEIGERWVEEPHPKRHHPWFCAEVRCTSCWVHWTETTVRRISVMT